MRRRRRVRRLRKLDASSLRPGVGWNEGVIRFEWICALRWMRWNHLLEEFTW
jgi:hypothetical protein